MNHLVYYDNTCHVQGRERERNMATFVPSDFNVKMKSQRLEVTNVIYIVLSTIYTFHLVLFVLI